MERAGDGRRKERKERRRTEPGVRCKVPIHPPSLQLSFLVDDFHPFLLQITHANEVIGRSETLSSRSDLALYVKKREEAERRNARDPSIHPSIASFFFDDSAGMTGG
jgi:hypothetical protein